MRRRAALSAVVIAGLLVPAGSAGAQSLPEPLVSDPQSPPMTPSCRFGRSQLFAGSLPLGRPMSGALRGGVRFPAATDYAFTWDFPLGRSPSRWWRRFGTEKLVLTIQCVLAKNDDAHPFGQRVGIADLSRPAGGPFGARYGGLGHASHQNGLDVDVLYPRRDQCECEPTRVSQIDVPRSQELIDAFVAAGAQYVFVSAELWRRGRLRGPGRVVQPLVHHDDHLHVRLRP